MSLPDLTEQFDTLYSTTWQLMREEAIDNIFKATPFWYYMGKGDRLRTETGGRWIGVQLEYATHSETPSNGDSSITWIGRKQDLSDANTNADKELVTTAKYDWKYLSGSLYRNYRDETQNKGRAAMMRIVDIKLTNMQKSLAHELETRLFDDQETIAHGGGEEEGDTMLGLKDICNTNPDFTGDELGGIDAASDHEWWRNQITDMEDENPAVYLLPRMRTMFNDCSVGGDMPNILVTSQRVFEMYEDEVLEYMQIVNRREGDASFDTILFKGRDMIWSPECEDDKLYFLNTDYLEFIADSDVNFAMTDWKTTRNDLDRVAQIVTMCNLVTSNRRMQGVIHNIGEESND